MNTRIIKLIEKSKEILKNSKEPSMIIEAMSQVNLFNDETTFDEFLNYFKEVDKWPLKDNEKMILKSNIVNRLLMKSKSLNKVIEVEDIIGSNQVTSLIKRISEMYVKYKDKNDTLSYFEKAYGSFEDFVKNAFDYATKNLTIENRDFYIEIFNWRKSLKDTNSFVLSFYEKDDLFNGNKLAISSKLPALVLTFIHAKNYERLNKLKQELETLYEEYNKKSINTHEDQLVYEEIIVAINSIELFFKSLEEEKKKNGKQ